PRADLPLGGRAEGGGEGEARGGVGREAQEEAARDPALLRDGLLALSRGRRGGQRGLARVAARAPHAQAARRVDAKRDEKEARRRQVDRHVPLLGKEHVAVAPELVAGDDFHEDERQEREGGDALGKGLARLLEDRVGEGPEVPRE